MTALSEIPDQSRVRRGRKLTPLEIKAIYTEYHYGGTSMTKIAEKWGISRRRVAAICK